LLNELTDIFTIVKTGLRKDGHLFKLPPNSVSHVL